MVTNQPSIQAQVNEVTQFATWFAGAFFLLWVGRTIGGAEKRFVNEMLDIATPKEIPVRIPQVLVEGGDLIPPQYHDMVGFINEPLSEYSLIAEFSPAVELEAGEKKIDAVMKQLKAGVEGIQDSYQFRLFLTTMSKFHDYSIGNQILIMLQKPEATRVAGFNTWKDMGRWVKTGEKGIAILAPVFPQGLLAHNVVPGYPRTRVSAPSVGRRSR